MISCLGNCVFDVFNSLVWQIASLGIPFLVGAFSGSNKSSDFNLTINNTQPINQVFKRDINPEFILISGVSVIALCLIKKIITTRNLNICLEDEDLWCNWRNPELSINNLSDSSLALSLYLEIMNEAEFKYDAEIYKNLLHDIKEELKLIRKIKTEYQELKRLKLNFFSLDLKELEIKKKRLQLLTKIIFSEKQKN